MVPATPRYTIRSALILAACIISFTTTEVRAADPPPAEIATAKAAFSAMGSRNLAAAKLAIQSLRNPALYRVAMWRLAVRQEAGLSFADYRALVSSVADWPNLTLLEVRAEQSIGPNDGANDIILWFESRPPRTLDGWRAYISALRKAGRKDAAEDAAREAWIKLPMSRADAIAFRSENAKAIGKAEHRDRILMLLGTGRWRAADRLIENTALTSSEKAALKVRVAMQKRSRNSAKSISQVLRSLPKKTRSDIDFLYDEIRWLRRTNRQAIAARRLLGAPKSMAKPRRWRIQRSIIVRELAEAKQTALAYRTAARHTHTDRLGVATFEFLAGWIALRLQGLPGRALPHFRKLHDVSESTISKSRGAYWAGRAARRLGNGRLARHWWRKAAAYPYTFYGQLSARRLGVKKLTLPKDLAASDAARKIFDADDKVVAVRLLHQLDDIVGARTMLWHLATRAETPDQFVLIAELARKVDRPEMSVRAGRNGLRDGVPIIGPAFPVISLPKTIEVDPALVLSITRQESEFYVAAISRAGARGMMQLLPRTAASVARALKLPFNRGRLTTDPVYNMRLGGRYLHRLLVRFRGSYVLAIAAYNAGPSRANDWIRRFGDPRSRAVNLIDWIEWVPFGETRNYIQRVLENHAVYTALSGTKSLSGTPRLWWTSKRHVNCANTRKC